MGAAHAAPVNPVHSKILNVKQIEFKDKTKGNFGRKVLGSITTPMMLNGVMTQDVGAIVLGESDMVGESTSVFPSDDLLIEKLDIAGYQVATLEYLKAVRAYYLWCSTDPASKASYEDRCTGEKGHCRTVQTKPAADCNVIANQKAFNEVLNVQNSKKAPTVREIKVCTNCNTFTPEDTYNKCFIAGTKVTMGDGSLKNIEDIQVGDIVLSFDFESQSFISTEVIKTFKGHKNNLMTINNVITSTQDHPYLRNDMQWASYDLERTQELHPDVQHTLNIGDELKMYNQEKTVIMNIDLHDGYQDVFTFAVNHKDHNYIANNFIVHNKRAGRD